jgi:hypothetical protein
MEPYDCTMEESEQNPNATVPGAQGSIVPLGWTPTPSKPVPVVRCIVIKKDGTRCGRWSLRGHTKCKSHLHGADMNFPHVRQYMDAVIEAARLRLVDSADDSITTLEFLRENASGEAIRLKAATEVLDRAGVRGGFEIDVEVEQKTNPAELLAKRLQTLRERHLESAGVVDAELVEDEPDSPQQETLF